MMQVTTSMKDPLSVVSFFVFFVTGCCDMSQFDSDHIVTYRNVGIFFAPESSF